jgi:hypothetical protein
MKFNIWLSKCRKTLLVKTIDCIILFQNILSSMLLLTVAYGLKSPGINAYVNKMLFYSLIAMYNHASYKIS